MLSMPSYAGGLDLTELGLQEILDLEITSVARRPVDPNTDAGAVFTITQDDIRSSGANTIPDVLKLVPGVDVAYIDNNSPAVSVRGFNRRFSSKLLIMIDGRTIYYPSMVGVAWDQQQLPVEEIARIEVHRGPAGSLWGANAVNGVINIVTQHAVDSYETLVNARGGTDGNYRIYGRHGGVIGDMGAYRLYGSLRETPALEDNDGDGITKDALGGQLGFRVDVEPNDRDAYSIFGEVYKYKSEMALDLYRLDFPQKQKIVEDVKADGAQLSARWVRTLSEGSSLMFQGVGEYVSRSEIDKDFKVSQKSIALETSYYFHLMKNLTILTGAGLSVTDIDYDDGVDISAIRDDVTDERYFGYLTGDLDLFDGRLILTSGFRLEDDKYTGTVFEPTARFMWQAPYDWKVWGALSRASRTPSFPERNQELYVAGLQPMSYINPSPLPAEIIFEGNWDLKEETLIAYEAGFRKSWSRDFSWDVAAYINDYDDLIEVQFFEMVPVFMMHPVTNTQVPVSVLQFVKPVNDISSVVKGIETSVKWQLSPDLKLSMTGDIRDYERLEVVDPLGIGGLTVQKSPEYQFGLKADYQYNPKLDITTWLRVVGDLYNTSDQGYWDINVRTGYAITPEIELSVIGENLVRSKRESISSLNFLPGTRGHIPRRVSLQLKAIF